MTMENPNVRLTDEHYKALMKIKKETGASVILQVRTAVEAYLNAKK